MNKKLVLGVALFIGILLSSNSIKAQQFIFSVNNAHTNVKAVLRVHYGDCNGNTSTGPWFNLWPGGSYSLSVFPNGTLPIGVELNCNGGGDIKVPGMFVSIPWCTGQDPTNNASQIPTFNCSMVQNGWVNYSFSVHQNAGGIIFNP